MIPTLNQLNEKNMRSIKYLRVRFPWCGKMNNDNNDEADDVDDDDDDGK